MSTTEFVAQMPTEPDADELPGVAEVGLPELAASHAAGEVRELRLLGDVQLELSVQLGRVRLPLRDLLSLSPGAVLELDRNAGDPVDVLVNGRLIARGEVVVVDGDFGVRISEITEPGRGRA
jgi:flagellar motor switch protein FliN/FliY